MKIKIVDRYIISEMANPFLMGVLGFIVIMVTDLLFALMDLIVNKGVPILIVLKLLVYKLPAILVLTFPVATLFAASMAIGRLARDSEVTVLRTSGTTFMRLSLPVIMTAILISMMTFFMNEKVVPMANRTSQRIIREIILKQPLTEVQEDIFFRDDRDRYFYIHRIDPVLKKMENIMIYEFIGQRRAPTVILAPRGSFSEEYWKIEKGVLHKYDEQSHLSYETSFDEMTINVDKDFLSFSEQRTPQEMNSMELKNQIDILKKGGVSTHSLAVDWYLKFAIPATAIVFALIGLPLSLISVKGGKMWGLILSIVIVMVFYVTASVLRSLGRGGMMEPILAAWLPHLVFGGVGLALILRESYLK